MRERRQALSFVLLLATGLLATAASAGGAPSLVQEHFRWRNDNGGEDAGGATWKAEADTGITGVPRYQNIRLRFCVANTNASNSGALSARLEYSTSTNGTWTAVPVETATPQPPPLLTVTPEPSSAVSPADAARFTEILASQSSVVPLAGPFNANLKEVAGVVNLAWANTALADFHASVAEDRKAIIIERPA